MTTSQVYSVSKIPFRFTTPFPDLYIPFLSILHHLIAARYLNSFLSVHNGNQDESDC